jgi:serine/threonine protein phosphatase PrpC
MNHSFRLFGVFDGHLGNRASNFLTRYLPHLFDSYLNEKENKSPGNYFEINSSSTLINDDWINSRLIPYGNHIIDRSLGTILRSKEAIQSLHNAFVYSNIEFISRSHDQETSGSTATIAILLGPEAETQSYPVSFTSHPSYKYLLIGHVGDSRAVLCCKSYQHGEAIPLTVDHTPSVPGERARVIEMGGFIESTKSIPRVNGQLAVTRSIGDKKLRMYLSSIPDLILLKLEKELFDEADQISSNKYENICSKYFNQRNINKSNKFINKFLILASDGLWDVISNQEAVNFTCKYLLNSLLRNEDSNDVLPTEAFHFAAKALAVEAFVRGSSDNIGVCIIDII